MIELEPPTVPIGVVPRKSLSRSTPWVPPILLVAVGLAGAVCLVAWGLYLDRESWNVAPLVTPPVVSAPSGAPGPP